MFVISTRCIGYLKRYNMVFAYIPIMRKSPLYRDLRRYTPAVSGTYGTRNRAKSLLVDKLFYR